jgi:pSer/pThr/pTyr-binding forkhead associated (FHA) protein
LRFFWLELNGARYTLREGETLIGRGPECTLYVDDTAVSRAHALVRRVGPYITISDLGSSNGTFVNGALVEDTRVLEPGDTVTVGNCGLKLGGDAIEPSAIPPAIEIIERRSERPQAQVTTDPQFGAIAVLESLVAGREVAEDPLQLATMIRSSVDRLLATTAARGQVIAPAEATRLSGVVQSVASWFPDHSLDAWAKQVRERLNA